MAPTVMCRGCGKRTRGPQGRCRACHWQFIRKRRFEKSGCQGGCGRVTKGASGYCRHCQAARKGRQPTIKTAPTPAQPRPPRFTCPRCGAPVSKAGVKRCPMCIRNDSVKRAEAARLAAAAEREKKNDDGWAAILADYLDAEIKPSWKFSVE